MTGSFSRLERPFPAEELPATDISETGSMDLLARLRKQNFALERLRSALDFEDDAAGSLQREPLPV